MLRVVFLFLFIPTISVAQHLSNTEIAIINAVDANNEDALKFLIDNVNLNSGSMNADGVRDLGMRYVNAYNALGFETDFIDQSEVNRGGHFIARKRGIQDNDYF